MAAQEIRIPREGGDIGGLLATPGVDGSFPGIVVVPTVRGLDGFAKYAVERLASDGFVALAVDIFDHPGVPSDPMQRSGAQPDERVLGDLEAGLAYLRKHAQVGDQPIGTWGYCAGGRFSLLWPTYQPGLVAAAAFHGFPTNDTSNPNTPTEAAGRVAELTVPVIACFGEADTLVPMSAVERYRAELEKAGKDHEIYTYTACKHGYTNPAGDNYVQDAAEDSWDRARKFLTRRVAAKLGS
jgi:carboxymethylenebutenolidase